MTGAAQQASDPGSLLSATSIGLSHMLLAIKPDLASALDRALKYPAVKPAADRPADGNPMQTALRLFLRYSVRRTVGAKRLIAGYFSARYVAYAARLFIGWIGQG